MSRRLEQEIGSGWIENVHPDDLGYCLQVYTSAIEERRPFSMEYRLRRDDGEWRWVLDHGMPTFDADGAFSGYLGSCIDVTEQSSQSSRSRARLPKCSGYAIDCSSKTSISVKRSGNGLARARSSDKAPQYVLCSSR